MNALCGLIDREQFFTLLDFSDHATVENWCTDWPNISRMNSPLRSNPGVDWSTFSCKWGCGRSSFHMMALAGTTNARDLFVVTGKAAQRDSADWTS